jgi:hypothetical protein
MFFLVYAIASVSLDLLLTASAVIKYLVAPMVGHLFPLLRLGRCTQTAHAEP